MNIVNIRNLPTITLNVVTDDGMKQLSKEAIIEILDTSGLDLVEVSNGEKPVYKILDYKKYLYEKEKTEKRNHLHNQATKEVKFGLNIQSHDIDTKLKNVKKFLADKDKVKIVVVMHGREAAHPEKAVSLANSILSQIHNGKVDSQIKAEGKFVTVMVKPI